ILLRQKSVQDELKLGEADVKKIREFTDKEYDEMEKAMKLGKEERRKKFKELGEKNKKFLKENLKPEQIKRLNQITMQCTALMQLRRPSVIKALKLTREQRRKINKLRREAREKLSTFLDEKDREGLSEKFKKLREETKKKVLAILTAKQKEKIREMVGEEFKGPIKFEKLEGKSKDK